MVAQVLASDHLSSNWIELIKNKTSMLVLLKDLFGYEGGVEGNYKKKIIFFDSPIPCDQISVRE